MQGQKQKPPSLVDDQLYNDETLLWWGKPIAPRLALQVNFLNILVSAGVAAFAVFFYTMSRDMMMGSSSFGGFGSSRSAIPALVSIMFTIVPGLMFLASTWEALQPVRKYITGLRTTYILTDRRAIIIKNLLTTEVRSFYDENIDRVQVQNFGNGTGSIIFATEQVTHYNRKRSITRTIPIGFLAIHDVRTVEDLFSQTFFEDKQAKNQHNNV